MIALADKITKSFGGRILYTQATLQLNAGERWALVGPNGAGKTTLLKIIMGQESPDEGTVSFAKETTAGYLEQETKIDGAKTALQEVVDSAHEVKGWERRVAELEAKISTARPGPDLDRLLEDYGHAQDRFERLGGYELDSRARQILGGLGFPVEDFDKPATDFSGGWQMRIALSKLLLRHPDLLLLDEPTNHLDLESVRWLEHFLATYDGAVLLVSHDRSFMDACVSHVAAVENRRLTTYTGNYSDYLRQREDNLEQMRAKRAAQEREIAHMQVFVDKFRYKPTKAAQAQERMRRIEQIKSELVILPEGSKKVRFSFPDPPRTGDTVVKVEDVSKAFGENHVYGHVDLNLYRGDHVALVGPNGAGKSTLGHVIMGDPTYKVTSGTITFDGQGITELSPDKRSLAGVFLSYQAPVEVPGVPLYSFLRSISQMRPKLKCTAREFRRRVGAIADELSLDQSFLMRELNVGFSGGEKKKIEMLQLLLLQPKLAILDETDSGLDVDALATVSHGIQRYRETVGGALIMITHNTRILERLTVDRTHVMVRGRLVADGPASLIDDIDKNGFERFEGKAAGEGDAR